MLGGQRVLPGCVSRLSCRRMSREANAHAPKWRPRHAKWPTPCRRVGSERRHTLSWNSPLACVMSVVYATGGKREAMTSPAPSPVAKSVVRLDALRIKVDSSRFMRRVGTADPDAQLSCVPCCILKGSGLAEQSVEFLFLSVFLCICKSSDCGAFRKPESCILHSMRYTRW